MVKLIDLNRPKVKDRQRQVRTYGTQTPLAAASVERGSTRWLSGSYVEINGVLDVTGTTTISGALNVSGTTTLSGSTTIAGPTGITGALTIAGSMSVTGPSTFAGTLGINGATTITGKLDVTGPTKLAGTLDITGNTKITGLLDITGKTTIRNDLELLSGGLFKAGVTKIEPTGRATFGSFIIDPSSNKLIQAPGGWMFSDGVDHLGLSSSESSSVQLSSTAAELNYKGASVVRAEAGVINLNAPQTSVNGKLVVTAGLTVAEISSARFRVTGLPTISGASNPPNLFMNASGVIFRTV